jgi:hypothetical protein
MTRRNKGLQEEEDVSQGCSINRTSLDVRTLQVVLEGIRHMANDELDDRWRIDGFAV